MNKYIEEHKEWIDSIWSKLDEKLSKTAIKSRDKLPYTTEDGIHDNRAITFPTWWTNGFWGGIMWLMYMGTHNEEYKLTALRSEELLDLALDKCDCLDHDVGFMWNITSGVRYRLDGDKKAKNRLKMAVALLASRFNSQAGYIRAWNGDGKLPKMTIIDTMMNLPMLFRASEEEFDDRLKHIALTHTEMAIRDHIRADGSVNHIVLHNPVTGEVERTDGGQGYDVGSSWSRGQAWAIYGFVLAYIHTNETKFLDIAKRTAHYFISCMSISDYLPLCDFRAPEEPVIYDSTAGACAACGLIEIAKVVPEYEKKLYIESAIKILKAIEEKFCDWSDTEDSILQMGTEAYKRGNHIPIIYGDYFFVEAIYKLRGNDFLMW